MKHILYIVLMTSCVSYDIKLHKKDYKNSDESFHRVKSQKVVELAEKTRDKHNRKYRNNKKKNQKIKNYNEKQIKKQEYNKRLFEFH